MEILIQAGLSPCLGSLPVSHHLLELKGLNNNLIKFPFPCKVKKAQFFCAVTEYMTHFPLSQPKSELKSKIPNSVGKS